MGKTAIEWTDFSVNPIRARLHGRTGHYCEKISPGCKNCYASRMQKRFGMPEFQEHTDSAVEHVLDDAKLREVLSRKKPTRFFWCDMSDLFGEWVPDEWIAACFGVMSATPHHIHQVLTKRAYRLPLFFRWLEEAADVRRAGRETPGEICRNYAVTLCGVAPGSDLLYGFEGRWPLPNVHVGVSVEDQTRAAERLPDLLSAAAAVRFVSAEPLLGPLDLSRWLSPCESRFKQRGIDWVIVGGESGPIKKARSLDPRWAIDVRHQCQKYNVAFFMKQMGTAFAARKAQWHKDHKGASMETWPVTLRVRETIR